VERKINNLSICYMFFLLLLFLAGSFKGIASGVLQISAYILPFVLGLILVREENLIDLKSFSLSADGLKFTIPIIFPTVFLVMLLSSLFAFLVNAITGAQNNLEIGDKLIPALISHALIPAVFEEALFRYLPMRMLKGHSKRLIILLSACLFALVHHSLFSFGYAFVAGVIFMAVDLICDSVIPSILIHFINNALSVGMLVYKDNFRFALFVFAFVAVISAISVIYIAINRTKYKQEIASVFNAGESFNMTMPMAIFGVACLAISIVSVL